MSTDKKSTISKKPTSNEVLKNTEELAAKIAGNARNPLERNVGALFLEAIDSFKKGKKFVGFARYGISWRE